MSTPEHPGTPPLTRRQMRDSRSTGATAVVPAHDATDVAPIAAPVFVPPPAPLARAAAPISVPEAPVPDASVDLGVSPLTRRQARQQERIRTASVPVITPEVMAAHAAQSVPFPSVPTAGAWQNLVGASATTQTRPEPATATIEDLFTFGPVTEPSEVVEAPQSVPASPAASAPLQERVPAPDDASEAEPSLEALLEPGAESRAVAGTESAEPRVVVNPELGAELLVGSADTIDVPPSFDQLISRSTAASGTSGATPKALIVPQTDAAASIVAPVAATGEVLITGTFNLPEGLGSLGHVPGTADGKEADAVLVDGELPAHSSPTPIAASAAISTVKNSGELIRPPAPEKGNKLMVSLAITAGILAAALLGVLAVAMISGVL